MNTTLPQNDPTVATFDGYVRVSRKMGRSGPGYISPTVQQESIQRWADYRGVKIAQWHVDEDESGGTQKRPGLVHAMERIEAGETGGLACWRLNRFARNVSGAITDIKRIQAAGAEIAFVEENIDCRGPFGDFMVTILLAVATLERDNIVASWEEAKTRAVARGAFIGITPFGYRRTADSTLEPDPLAAPMIVETYRLAAAGSLHGAVAYLNKATPDRFWNATTTRRTLRNRVYLGETRSGKDVAANTHEPLVSRAVWEAAQIEPKRYQSSHLFPLSGVLLCGSCGGPMVGGRGGNDNSRTYRCAASLPSYRDRSCSGGANVKADLVESYVHNVVENLLSGAQITIGSPDGDALDGLERTLVEAEAELDAFLRDLTARRAYKDRPDRYEHLVALRSEAVTRARAAYNEAARSAQVSLTMSTPKMLEDPHRFTTALGSVFSGIIVRRGRGHISNRVLLVPVDADRTSGVLAAQSA